MLADDTGNEGEVARRRSLSLVAGLLTGLNEDLHLVGYC
jgi:hypothetical protein